MFAKHKLSGVTIFRGSDVDNFLSILSVGKILWPYRCQTSVMVLNALTVYVRTLKNDRTLYTHNTLAPSNFHFGSDTVYIVKTVKQD